LKFQLAQGQENLGDGAGRLAEQYTVEGTNPIFQDSLVDIDGKRRQQKCWDNQVVAGICSNFAGGSRFFRGLLLPSLRLHTSCSLLAATRHIFVVAPRDKIYTQSYTKESIIVILCLHGPGNGISVSNYLLP